MDSRVNTLLRWSGFAWIGVVAFAIYPPSGPDAMAAQAAGYGAAGLSLTGWAVLDHYPPAARFRPRGLPVVLGMLVAASAWASAAAGEAAIAMIIFGFIASMIIATDASLTAALAVTAAGVLAAEAGGLVFSGSYGQLLGVPLVLASGLVLGRNRASYRIQAEQAAALLAQREALEAEQRRADLLDERARIAREIHDVLAHSLGALSIQIQAARSVLADRADVDKAASLLATAQRLAAEGLTETRRAVHALRADTLPLSQELARATDTYSERYHVKASFATSGDPLPVPPDATVALLRVAQEALVNAAKHAAGQPVALRLDYAGAGVQLTVANDLAPEIGAGHRPGLDTANSGYGLTGMTERLRLLNGTLRAGRADGQWVVSAELPVASAEPPVASAETMAP